MSKSQVRKCNMPYHTEYGPALIICGLVILAVVVILSHKFTQERYDDR